jgi:Zn-dependent M16 (insulinase) family peptidase
LFRGTPYAFDTGGNPKEITTLEYSELKKMYEHYYHPSNMAFYFYGKGSISNHL